MIRVLKEFNKRLINKQKKKHFSMRDCFAILFFYSHFSPRHVRVFLRHCDFIDRRIGALCNFDDVQADLNSMYAQSR